MHGVNIQKSYLKCQPVEAAQCPDLCPGRLQEPVLAQDALSGRDGTTLQPLLFGQNPQNCLKVPSPVISALEPEHFLM